MLLEARVPNSQGFCLQWSRWHGGNGNRKDGILPGLYFSLPLQSLAMVTCLLVKQKCELMG